MDGWAATRLYLRNRSTAANLLQVGARDELAGHSRRGSSPVLWDEFTGKLAGQIACGCGHASTRLGGTMLLPSKCLK